MPELGSIVPPDAEPSQVLLSAIGLQLSGAREPWQQHQLVMGRHDASKEQKVSATILGAISLADANRTNEAVTLLREASILSDESLHVALIDLHLGIRAAEAGQIPDAVEATEKAIVEVGRGRDHRLWRSSIRVIATFNKAAYRALTGEFTTEHLPSRTGTLTDRVVRIERAALRRFLDEDFESRLDAGDTTVIGRMEDTIERDLFRAVLRSECLADWYELLDTRRQLGRYQVLTALSGDAHTLVPAFHLLRRGRDKKSLRLATRSLRHAGPLPILAAIGNSFASIDWADHEEEVVAAVLEGTTDMLTEANAHAVSARIVSRPNLDRREFWVPVMARLQRMLRGNQQLPILRTLHAAISAEPRAYVSHEIARAVHVIDWRSVPTAERRKWTRFLKDHLDADGDRRQIAEALADGLAAAEQALVTQEVNRALRARVRLALATSAVNAEISFEKDVVARLRVTCKEAMQRVRSEASKGSYSLGGVSLAHLFAHLLVTYGGEPVDWSDLVDFLIDPHVADTEKGPALDYLASRSEDLSNQVRARLASELPNLTAFHDLLFGSHARLQAARLRLAVALGQLDEENAFSRLVGLATEETAQARVEAATSISSLYRSFHSGGVLTVGLMLSRDGVAEVRAEAGHSLAAISAPLEAELERLRLQRLRELLQEPGVLVPLRVLHGFQRSQTGHLILDATIRKQVEAISRESPSAILRDAAVGVRKIYDR